MVYIRKLALLAAGLVLAAGLWAQGKPVDLEFWIGGTYSEAGAPPDDWVAYKIIKDKLNINVKFVMLPATFDDQDKKLNTAAAANRLPDLAQYSRDLWYKFAQKSLLAPIDELVPKMSLSFKTVYSDPTRRKLATIGGKLYALPAYASLPGTEGMFIRKDWLDKLKLPVPKTLDDLVKVAKAFTEQDPDGNGKNDTYGFGAFLENSDITDQGLGRRFDNIFGAFGVAGMWNVSSAKAFGLNFRNPDFYKAVGFVKSLVDAKVIDPDWSTLKKEEFRTRWKAGKFGIMRESFSGIFGQANYKPFDELYPNGEWLPIAPVAGPSGKASQGLLFVDMRYYGISARAMKDGKGEAIARLIEWMNSDEGYHLLNYGVEGVNYKKDANGDITMDGIPDAQKYTNRSVQPGLQLRNMIRRYSDPELKATYLNFKSKSGRILNPLENYRKVYNQTWTPVAAAQLITPPNNAADFYRFYNEQLIKFVLGLQPLNDKSWAGFIAGLDKLGAKELEAKSKADLVAAGLLD